MHISFSRSFNKYTRDTHFMKHFLSTVESQDVFVNAKWVPLHDAAEYLKFSPTRIQVFGSVSFSLEVGFMEAEGTWFLLRVARHLGFPASGVQTPEGPSKLKPGLLYM